LISLAHQDAPVLSVRFMHLPVEKQKKSKRTYRPKKYADLSLTPVPDYHLLKLNDYAFIRKLKPQKRMAQFMHTSLLSDDGQTNARLLPGWW